MDDIMALNRKRLLKRQEENADLLERMKRGEPLQRPSSESWFPDRPKIEKDFKAVKRLYEVKD